ncbi:hypothetical protein F6Y05_00745 [Bacillus megaterium]|nr:hypothetical protein [Priestia megaterium]
MDIENAVCNHIKKEKNNEKSSHFCSVLILLLLGGGIYIDHSREKQMEQKQNDQMFHKAEQAAITYFKEKDIKT